MRERHCCNVPLTVIGALAVKSRFGCRRIVQHKTHLTFSFLNRAGMKRENVDVLLGQRLTDLSKCPRLVFQIYGEFLSDRHNWNLLPVYLGDGLGLLRDSAEVRMVPPDQGGSSKEGDRPGDLGELRSLTGGQT